MFAWPHVLGPSKSLPGSGNRWWRLTFTSLDGMQMEGMAVLCSLLAFLFPCFVLVGCSAHDLIADHS